MILQKVYVGISRVHSVHVYVHSLSITIEIPSLNYCVNSHRSVVAKFINLK